jgi:FtsH-binding integral membrane protein
VGNGQMVDIPVVQNAYNVVFTIAAFILLGVVAWKAWVYYQKEDEMKMGKVLFWGFLSAILVWRTMDVINIFLNLFDKIKG